MNGRILFAALVYSLIITVDITVSQDPEAQFCEAPRPTLIPIDAPYFNYWPFYVKLNRCGGSCSTTSPRIQRCIAGEIANISFTVFHLAAQKNKVLQLTNHTKCKCSCAQTPDSCMADVEEWDPADCSCKCIQPANQPLSCPNGFSWSQHYCRCICTRAPELCTANKKWSNEACRCICKMDIVRRCNDRQQLLNYDTCTCYDNPPDIAAREGKGVPRDVVIGSMVAELIFLVVLFDAFLFYKYRQGIMARVYYNCCAKDTNQDAHEEAASVPLNCELENGEKAEEPKTDEQKC